MVPAAPLPPVIPAAEIPPPPPPPIDPADGSDMKASNSDEKTLGIVMYLLPLLGLGVFTHVGGLALMAVAPLVLWLIKKDTSRYLDTAGKEVINFNICAIVVFLALWVIWGIAVHIWLGWLFTLIIWVTRLAWVVVTVLGAVTASSGTVYRFPFNYPIVK
jgi:uncharacterized Tic20 family protein